MVDNIDLKEDVKIEEKPAGKPETKKPEVKAEKAAPVFEAKYTMAELLDAAKNLGTNRVVVRAALTSAKKDAYTMNEAKQLIDRFKHKEVNA